MVDIDKSLIEKMVKDILAEKLGAAVKGECCNDNMGFMRKKDSSGVISVKVPTVRVSESDRLDTGKSSDIVYTKDLFTLEESGRLGCGIMEMKQTTFDWTLNYDEIDYVIDGHLDIIVNNAIVSADAGELILIPKGSTIKFSVPNYARFIYVTYPADWASQN